MSDERREESKIQVIKFNSCLENISLTWKTTSYDSGKNEIAAGLCSEGSTVKIKLVSWMYSLTFHYVQDTVRTL